MGALAAVLLTGIPDALKNALTDLRFHWFPRQASGDVVVVAIDARSIEAIGIWPWPRRLHAELIGKLEDAGASDIVFDIDFSTPSNPAFDQAFVEALQKAGGSVVLPSFKQLADGRSREQVHLNRPLPPFGENSWPAIVNVSVEPNGVVRRYPFGETFDGKFLPSMGAVLAGSTSETRNPFGSISASSPIASRRFPMWMSCAAIPSWQNGSTNKKVIIGGTALELGDKFNIPNGQDRLGSVAAVVGRRVHPARPCATPDLGSRAPGRPRFYCASHGGFLAPLFGARARRGSGRVGDLG